MDSSKYMFLICGAPGSGKSTLAKKITSLAEKYIRPIVDVCEADDYFYTIGGGKYTFNPKLLGNAHEFCQNKAWNYATGGHNFIVSNTGIKRKDRTPYFNIAKMYGYKVVFIHLTTEYGSIHNVPKDVIDRMKDTFQEPDSTELDYIITKDDMSNELENLLKDSEVNYGC